MLAAGRYTELYPIAEQASRIIDYIAQWTDAVAESGAILAARVGRVSAEQVATAKHVLVDMGYLEEQGFSHRVAVSSDRIARLSVQLEGVADYLNHHKDRDTVRVIITEPGHSNALRAEIDRRSTLPPLLLQTTDALINLARSAQRELIVLIPFMDDEGTDFLIELFRMSKPIIQPILILRAVNEKACGPAFWKRHLDFTRLAVGVYEYNRPSSLPSGRETFHAKIVLADDETCYIGSSNLIGAALERSLECGVLLTGKTAGYCAGLLDAARTVSNMVQY
jgi:hypothetical protein